MLRIVRWTLTLLLAFIAFAQTNGQNQRQQPISEIELQSILDVYNSKAREFARFAAETQWDVETDIGNDAKVEKKVLYTQTSCCVHFTFGNIIVVLFHWKQVK